MNIANLMNQIQIDVECQICYEPFIKLSYEQYDDLMRDCINILPNSFEDDTCCRLYVDRFECLTCRHIICRHCYWSFKNHKYRPAAYDAHIETDADGMAEGCPGDDCPIICPFCRTKDYKIFYGNEIPYELLSEIKNYRRRK